MDLKWFDHEAKRDGEKFKRQFLVDMESERIWGYVEAPGRDEFTFLACPYHDSDRFYLGWDAAKAYLEASAIETLHKEIEAAVGKPVLQRESLSEEGSTVNSVVKADP